MQTQRVDHGNWAARSREAWQKRWVKVAVAVVAVVILVLIVTPMFINADTFRPLLESEMSSALGRKVTLGHLSFSLFSGSLTARNIAIADDPAFESAPFLTAKSLHIGVQSGALLFHRQLRITKFVADSPEVHIISNQNGTWNYASLGHSSSAATQKQSSAPNVSVGDLKIANGTVAVSSVPATGKPFVYNNVNVTVQHLSYTRQMPFQLSADLPGNGSVALNGTAGPVSQQDLTATPLQASLTVKHFDPVTAGVLPASEGISMIADVNANVRSDGKTLASTGTVHAAHLLLSRGGSPAPQPVDLSYSVSDNLQARTGQVQDIAVHTGSVAAHVNGTFQITAQAVNLNLHLSAPNMPIDGLEQLLPAVGIRLPSGSSLHGGTLTANLDMKGTASAPQITGPVEIDNTQLAGFNLGSKIQGLKALSGAVANATAIRTLRANVNSTVPSTQLTNIYADVPDIGTATGNGTVSAAGALDFQLVAKFSSSGAGAIVNDAASALGGIAGSLLHSTVSNGIPLTVTGTTSNPVIRADLGHLLSGKNAKKPSAAGVVKSLLGR